MAEQKFEVKGSFKNGYDYQPFTKVVTAISESMAVKTTYATFGSKHRITRNYIKIDSVKVINGE